MDAAQGGEVTEPPRVTFRVIAGVRTARLLSRPADRPTRAIIAACAGLSSSSSEQDHVLLHMEPDDSSRETRKKRMPTCADQQPRYFW